MALREHNSALPSCATSEPATRSCGLPCTAAKPARPPGFRQGTISKRRVAEIRIDPVPDSNPAMREALPSITPAHSVQAHAHWLRTALVLVTNGCAHRDPPGQGKGPPQARAQAACLLRRQASKRKGPCAVLRPHRDQSGVGVRHALFPVPALGATEGCRLPDAIPRGKAELSAS